MARRAALTPDGDMRVPGHPARTPRPGTPAMRSAPFGAGAARMVFGTDRCDAPASEARTTVGRLRGATGGTPGLCDNGRRASSLYRRLRRWRSPIIDGRGFPSIRRNISGYCFAREPTPTYLP